MNNIRENLALHGIEIVDKWDSKMLIKHKHRIPADVDVVLLNHEMISHGIQDHVKSLANKSKKRLVFASMNTSKTLEELVDKKVIDPSRLLPIVDIPPTEAQIAGMEPVPQKISRDEKKLVIGDFELFDDKGQCYCICGAGHKRRRQRPVVVGDSMFVSQSEAANFLEMSNDKIGDMLNENPDGFEWSGFNVKRPTYEQAVPMIPFIVNGGVGVGGGSSPRIPMPPKGESYLDPAEQVESTTFPLEVNGKKIDVNINMKMLTPHSDDPVEQWRMQTRELRTNLQVEKQQILDQVKSMSIRVEEINKLLDEVPSL